MDRLKTRWTAWLAALLLVLSVSGVAGASALISFNGPAASALENSAVALALKAALGADDEDEGDANTGDEDADDSDDGEQPKAPDGEEGDDEEDAAKAAPTQEELQSCVEDLDDPAEAAPAEGESHGDYVSRIAGDKTIVGGPNDNHGFCVSAAARGLFGEAADDGTDAAAAAAPTDEELASCAGEGGDVSSLSRQEGESHGDYVSRIAGDVTIVGGPAGKKPNHGFCVSAAARGLFDEETGAAVANADATCVAKDKAKGKDKAAKRATGDEAVEDEDVADAATTCDAAKDKAAKDKAKAGKGKGRGMEHGKRHGKGHRP